MTVQFIIAAPKRSECRKNDFHAPAGQSALEKVMKKGLTDISHNLPPMRVVLINGVYQAVGINEMLDTVEKKLIIRHQRVI